MKGTNKFTFSCFSCLFLFCLFSIFLKVSLFDLDLNNGVECVCLNKNVALPSFADTEDSENNFYGEKRNFEPVNDGDEDDDEDEERENLFPSRNDLMSSYNDLSRNQKNKIKEENESNYKASYDQEKERGEGEDNDALVKCSLYSNDKNMKYTEECAKQDIYIKEKDLEYYRNGFESIMNLFQLCDKHSNIDCILINNKKVLKDIKNKTECQICIYQEKSDNQKHTRVGEFLDLNLNRCMNGIFEEEINNERKGEKNGAPLNKMKNSSFHSSCHVILNDGTKNLSSPSISSVSSPINSSSSTSPSYSFSSSSSSFVDQNNHNINRKEYREVFEQNGNENNSKDKNKTRIEYSEIIQEDLDSKNPSQKENLNERTEKGEEEKKNIIYQKIQNKKENENYSEDNGKKNRFSYSSSIRKH